MTPGRRLRVLVEYPGLGKPGDTRDGSIPDAQAFVNLGYAEYVVERTTNIETTERAAAPEASVKRPTKRTRTTDAEQR